MLLFLNKPRHFRQLIRKTKINSVLRNYVDD